MHRWRRSGISSLLVNADNYGYMGPIKAALESATRFLAKSSVPTRDPLQTSLARSTQKRAPRPAFRATVESYLYAEKLTFRSET